MLAPPPENIGAALAYALQLSLGIVFLLAAIPKLRHPRAFAATVAAYRIVPQPISPTLASGLIAIESYLAFAFLSGWSSAFALPLAGVTLLAFSVAAGINLRRGRRVRCGCFGDSSERISGRSLVRLSVLLLAVAALAFASGVAGTSAVTVGAIAGSGVSTLPYLLETLGMAVFLILMAQWMLTGPELASILRQSIRIEPPDAGGEREQREVA